MEITKFIYHLHIVLSSDPHGIRHDVINLFQDSKHDAKVTCSTLADALLITPLPEDLMLHTLIPSFLPPSPKALNLKLLELVCITNTLA